MVRNLSEGGALIVDTVPNASIDTPATLAIDGMATRLDGVIARSDQDGTLIKFKLTEAAEKMVKHLVSGRHAA